jgi:type III secretion protein T
MDASAGNTAPLSAAVSAVLGEARLPLAAFGLSMARLLGLLQILPISSRLGLHGMHRAGVAAGLSLPLLPLVLGQLAAADLSGGRFVLLTAKESFVGFAIGVLFALPFWAVETAGELIDQQRGSRGATISDPDNQEENGITATLLVLTLTTLFFLSGGMHWLLDGVFDSYRIWPVLTFAPDLAPGASMAMLSMLDGILDAGLVLAAPMLIAMLLAELSLALISRFAARLNVFDLSMSVKGLVQVVGLPVYAVFLIGYMRHDLAPLTHVGATLRSLTGR